MFGAVKWVKPWVSKIVSGFGNAEEASSYQRCRSSDVELCANGAKMTKVRDLQSAETAMATGKRQPHWTKFSDIVIRSSVESPDSGPVARSTTSFPKVRIRVQVWADATLGFVFTQNTTHDRQVLVYLRYRKFLQTRHDGWPWIFNSSLLTTKEDSSGLQHRTLLGSSTEHCIVTEHC